MLEAKKSGMPPFAFGRVSVVDEAGTEATFAEMSGAGVGGVKGEATAEANSEPLDGGIEVALDTEEVPDWKEDIEKGSEGMGGSFAFDKSDATS